jgi:hypothetical protein
MSYDDLKVIEAYNFLRSATEPAATEPSATEPSAYGSTLDDAVRSAEALEAMTLSAERGTWVSLA